MGTIRPPQTSAIGPPSLTAITSEWFHIHTWFLHIHESRKRLWCKLTNVGAKASYTRLIRSHALESERMSNCLNLCLKSSGLLQRSDTSSLCSCVSLQRDCLARIFTNLIDHVAILFHALAERVSQPMPVPKSAIAQAMSRFSGLSCRVLFCMPFR